jgi:hypothetical protein
VAASPRLLHSHASFLSRPYHLPLHPFNVRLSLTSLFSVEFWWLMLVIPQPIHLGKMPTCSHILFSHPLSSSPFINPSIREGWWWWFFWTGPCLVCHKPSMLCSLLTPLPMLSLAPQILNYQCRFKLWKPAGLRPPACSSLGLELREWKWGASQRPTSDPFQSLPQF